MQIPENFFNVEFGKAMAFGYRTEDVDEFVTTAMEIIKGLQKENQELTEKMNVLAQSLEKYREDEESLRSALIGAQKLGDSILKDSRSKAEVILREATTNADHIVEEAHARLEREKADYDRLKAEVATFREGLFDLYKNHIDQISRLPHKDKPAAQKAAPKAPEPPAPLAEPEPELELEPIPAPTAPKKVPAPEPAPRAEEPEEAEDYLPDPVPEPPVKRAPVKRPALRLELDYDEEDEDDEIESDDEILSRFSRSSSRRSNFRTLPQGDDFEDGDEDDDDRPLSRTIFSSKFGEMRFGEGFDLTQDDRGKTAGGRAGGRRR